MGTMPIPSAPQGGKPAKEHLYPSRTLPALKQLTEDYWERQIPQTIKPPAGKSADNCKHGFLLIHSTGKGFFTTSGWDGI